MPELPASERQFGRAFRGQPALSLGGGHVDDPRRARLVRLAGQFLPAANLAAIERKSSVWNDWFSADNA